APPRTMHEHDHLQLEPHGKVAANFSARVRATTVTLPIDRNSWLLALAYSDKPRYPVLDLYPFGSTSPVYVKIDNAPTSCREDAEYFLKWIDVLSQRVRTDTNWN